jgi:predicted dehydrogenase
MAYKIYKLRWRLYKNLVTNMKALIPLMMIPLFTILGSCSGKKPQISEIKTNPFTGVKGEVKLMILDPGHFHAALVQKSMQSQIDTNVYVFAPEGSDVQDHLAIINGYNSRQTDPTRWNEILYTGPGYLEKMLAEKPGNLMVVAGNNAKKTEYIKKAIDAGINVLADKPMVISPDKFPMLEESFKSAEKNHVLLYDIMTERYEITNIVQRALAEIPGVFGELLVGTSEQPAITKESVHHFFKYVSGNPIKRPAWFFDTDQQGEGIADVTTHLVDLVQWAAFPEQIIEKTDIEMISARHWATELTPAMFNKVTSLGSFPDYLNKYLKGNVLKVYSNGEMNYRIKGKYARVSVEWKFEAPEGAGDTHYSIMRGSMCNLVIKQNKDQEFKPVLYVEVAPEKAKATFENNLKKAIDQNIAVRYPGISVKKLKDNLWSVEIPEKYKTGHEAHFGEVTAKYLQYLVDGKLPVWEVPDMITKYYITMEALKMAQKD